jgi:hypothetical protein
MALNGSRIQSLQEPLRLACRQLHRTLLGPRRPPEAPLLQAPVPQPKTVRYQTSTLILARARYTLVCASSAIMRVPAAHPTSASVYRPGAAPRPRPGGYRSAQRQLGTGRRRGIADQRLRHELGCRGTGLRAGHCVLCKDLPPPLQAANANPVPHTVHFLGQTATRPTCPQSLPLVPTALPLVPTALPLPHDAAPRSLVRPSLGSRPADGALAPRLRRYVAEHRPPPSVFPAHRRTASYPGHPVYDRERRRFSTTC